MILELLLNINLSKYEIKNVSVCSRDTLTHAKIIEFCSICTVRYGLS